MDSLFAGAIEFTVPGKPIAWARTGTSGTRRFTPAVQHRALIDYATLAKAAMRGHPPLEGPISLRVDFFWPVPPSWSKRKAAAAVWHTGRPDVDNLAKLIGDALNGVCWHDDAQITELRVSKLIGPWAETKVFIRALQEGKR